MNIPLMKELAQTGLHSVSIIFNSSSRYTESGWIVLENDEGKKLYDEFFYKLNYKIEEVHSTVWQCGAVLRKDTCYSVNLKFPLLKKKKEVELILRQILRLAGKFNCAQIILNNHLALDKYEFQIAGHLQH